MKKVEEKEMELEGKAEEKEGSRLHITEKMY
jgi:hypothetical protein